MRIAYRAADIPMSPAMQIDAASLHLVVERDKVRRGQQRLLVRVADQADSNANLELDELRRIGGIAGVVTVGAGSPVKARSLPGITDLDRGAAGPHSIAHEV